MLRYAFTQFKLSIYVNASRARKHFERVKYATQIMSHNENCFGETSIDLRILNSSLSAPQYKQHVGDILQLIELAQFRHAATSFSVEAHKPELPIVYRTGIF